MAALFLQRLENRRTRDEWERYSSHRCAVTSGIQVYAFNEMLQRFLSQLVSERHTIKSCNPRVVTDIVSDDPHLNRTLRSVAPELAWLWQQGPSRQALVYTLPIVRQGVIPCGALQYAPLGAM